MRVAEQSNHVVIAATAARQHVLTDAAENRRLAHYEQQTKNAFDGIVPTLKKISALQHERNFEHEAQHIARNELGYELPQAVLADAWVEQLDMRRLFAWCVFETYQRYSDDFYSNDPLSSPDEAQFQDWLHSCGFHALDVSPCADGRLAHVIRYVMRFPYRLVRRKSFAGAMFDIDDSLNKWTETELVRFREGVPNTADQPTRYLKTVVYHFSSRDPAHQGCAAHGSDTALAAKSGLAQLLGFQQAVQNTHCCGADIDLLLVGLDTDTDSLRVHVPNGNGELSVEKYVDTLALFHQTAHMARRDAELAIDKAIRACCGEVVEGMQRFITRLITNNLSQIDYVREYHGGHYDDAGHAERFIGTGMGFEDVQLRNLTFFSYMKTVEEAAGDLDVGVKIFSGLNVAHGLPIPVIVRFDYHGDVPGSRKRAVLNCERVTRALTDRYADLVERGLLHIMQVIRDCESGSSIEMLACSAMHTACSYEGGSH